jgi:hypothetical protein
VGTQGDEYIIAVTLSPPLSKSIALVLFVAFLVFVGWVGLSAGTLEHSWWFVLPTWGLAAFGAYAVVAAFRRRRQFMLRITRGHFSVYGFTVHRPEVSRIYRHKELLFDGVRVDLADGEWLGILRAHHEPRDVLKAFRSEGYPVEDGLTLV